MIKFNKHLDWFKRFYPSEISQLENFVGCENMPHLIFTGKGCSDKGLIAQKFVEEFSKNGGLYKIIYGGDPITSEEREIASSMKYVSKSMLGSSAGETKLVDPFLDVRVKPWVEEGTIGKVRILMIYDFDCIGKLQESFRRLMEDYVDNCKFILICEEIGNIIDPIISRCHVINFSEISDSDFDNGLIDLIDHSSVKSIEVASILRNCSEKSFTKSLLIASASLSKYKIINTQSCKNVIKKRNSINLLLKNFNNNKLGLLILEIRRFIQYNYLEWSEFSSELLKILLVSNDKNRDNIILLLSEYDANYSEVEVEYYIIDFLAKLKEMYK